VEGELEFGGEWEWELELLDLRLTDCIAGRTGHARLFLERRLARF
jgi:hypothetical protein